MRLNVSENNAVVKLSRDRGLDFDDSYQWVTSEKYNTQLVTFDKDFLKRGFKTITPVEALQNIKRRKR